MAQQQVQTTTDTQKPASNGAFAVLRRPNFAWFLLGTTLSNSAQWIQQVTLSWLVYDLTSSGAMLGALNLVRAIATLGLAPLAGVAIDRLPRRGLLYATSGWLFAISLVFGFVLLAYPTLIWPLFIFTFLGGIAQAVSMPLRQTMVFVLVPRSEAPSAVALVQTGWAVMRSIGPALGGFLILWFGPAGNFFVQAGAYALVVLTVTRLTFPPERLDSSKVTTGSGLREGLHYVATEHTTRAFLMMGWILPLLIIPNFSALPPIYAKDIFSGGPDTLGMLLSAVGIGGIAGGFVTASLGQPGAPGIAATGGAPLAQPVADRLCTQLRPMGCRLVPGPGRFLRDDLSNDQSDPAPAFDPRFAARPGDGDRQSECRADAGGRAHCRYRRRPGGTAHDHDSSQRQRRRDCRDRLLCLTHHPRLSSEPGTGCCQHDTLCIEFMVFLCQIAPPFAILRFYCIHCDIRS